MYFLVPPYSGYRTFGYFIVVPCTVMYPLTGNQGIAVSEIRVNAGMYQCILVQTSSYWYVLLHTNKLMCVLVHTTGIYCTVLTVTYKYIPVYSSTYQHIPVCTRSYWFILAHTGTYQYIPVHTHTYLFWSGSKKNANGFRTRESSAYCSHAFPLHCKSTDTKYRICITRNVCVHIPNVHVPAACVPGSWWQIDSACPAPPPPPAMRSSSSTPQKTCSADAPRQKGQGR